MKKTLIITLVTGRVINRDITNVIQGAPIGAPANDPFYAQLCASVASNGYTDTDMVTDKLYTHIAPSQIATVAVMFE